MFVKNFYKALNTLENEGLLALIFKIFYKLKSEIFDTNSSIWFVKELDEVWNRGTKLNEYEIIFDDLNTIIAWMKEKNDEYNHMYSEKEISVAREYGHLIPFLKYKNEIIGYTKVALKQVYIRDYDAHYSLAKNKAMFYDTTFLANHRAKRLPRYLKNELFFHLKSKKINFIFAHIEPWNIASIKSNEGLGFKAIGLNKYVRICCFKYHSNNPKKLLS